MNTCPTCGQAVAESETSFKMLLERSCDDNWRTGWNAVRSNWDVDEFKVIGDKVVTKVYDTDTGELDGYSTVTVEMVFQEGYEYWKITGSWSSYDGIEWEDRLVKVEQKERTSVYYG